MKREVEGGPKGIVGFEAEAHESIPYQLYRDSTNSFELVQAPVGWPKTAYRMDAEGLGGVAAQTGQVFGEEFPDSSIAATWKQRRCPGFRPSTL